MPSRGITHTYDFKDKKLGFNYCGTIYVHEDNDPRMAFEKVSHRI